MNWDYRPINNGIQIDPVDGGGSVTSLVLYDSPARTGTPEATIGPALKVGPGRYRFTIPSLPPGRYWGVVTFVPGTALPSVTENVRLDLPTGTGLVVSPEMVASLLGVALPLSIEAREIFIENILDAQSDVENALNRPLIPTSYVISAVRPFTGGMTDMWDWRAWESYSPMQFNDEVHVTGWIGPDVNGYYTVTVSVGLDVTMTSLPHPVARYIAAHAAESIRINPALNFGSRQIRSLSAEGQSVSYVDIPTGGSGTGGGGNSGAKAGSLPTLASLARFKRPSIYMTPRRAENIWPYGGYGGGIGFLCP